MTEPVLGPSASGSVVLDLGPGAGALVLHAPPELVGCEIQLSPRDPSSGATTHSVVRSRRTAGGAQYAAVYPGLRPGEYVAWLNDRGAELPVIVRSGQVTAATWH